MKAIRTFSGNNGYLSNFYKSDVLYEGVFYPTVENAFQAAKVKHKEQITTNDTRIQKGFTVAEPGRAKSIGRKVDLREDWEEVKDSIMYEILLDKFSRNEVIREKLLSTDDCYLEEGTMWHDNYWGCCRCSRCSTKPKLNKLGLTLMRVREHLKQIE